MHSVAEKKMWQNSTEGALLHLGDSMSPAILGYLAFHISRYYRVKAARQAPFPDNVDVPKKTGIYLDITRRATVSLARFT